MLQLSLTYLPSLHQNRPEIYKYGGIVIETQRKLKEVKWRVEEQKKEEIEEISFDEIEGLEELLMPSYFAVPCVPNAPCVYNQPPYQCVTPWG